jgi:hypothetical protein
MVDLPNSLMGFVHTVDKRQPDVARLHFKLRQDGVAKGLCGDTRSVGNKKDCSVWHCYKLSS